MPPEKVNLNRATSRPVKVFVGKGPGKSREVKEKRASSRATSFERKSESFKCKDITVNGFSLIRCGGVRSRRASAKMIRMPDVKFIPSEIVSFVKEINATLDDVGYSNDFENMKGLLSGKPGEIVLNSSFDFVIKYKKANLIKLLGDSRVNRILAALKREKSTFTCKRNGAVKCGPLTLRNANKTMTVIPKLFMMPAEVVAFNKTFGFTDRIFSLRNSASNIKRINDGKTGEVVLNLEYAKDIRKDWKRAENLLDKHYKLSKKQQKRSEILYSFLIRKHAIEKTIYAELYDCATDGKMWFWSFMYGTILYIVFKPELPKGPPSSGSDEPRPANPTSPDNNYRRLLWEPSKVKYPIFKPASIPVHVVPHTVPITIANESPIMGAAMATAKVGLSSEVVRQTAKKAAKIGFWATLAAGAVKVFSTVKTVAFGFARALPSMMFRAGNAAASGVLPPVFVVPEECQTFEG
ncbi:MAG: hypothetical protein ABIE74_06940 [Pseudomonadota bacterium]